MNYEKKIGQGTWMMGENKEKETQELETLKRGVDLGITMIDTAEMYGEGRTESLVGKTIKNYKRESLYLVSKVYPHNAGRNKIFTSCQKSLERLGTHYLDLYLLHWPGQVPIEETVECMEELKERKWIKEWGVSNFNTEEMKELLRVPMGKNCATNQVLYHLGSRGIEYSLLPLMEENNIKIMAYSPVARAGELNKDVFNNRVLNQVAEKNDLSIFQVLLAFVTKKESIMAIPKASTLAHVEANAKLLDFALSDEDYAAIEREFPAPNQETFLDII